MKTIKDYVSSKERLNLSLTTHVKSIIDDLKKTIIESRKINSNIEKEIAILQYRIGVF